MKIPALIASAALGLMACAHGAPNGSSSAASADTFDMSVSGQGGVTVVCQGDRCIGPQVQVKTGPSGMQGTLAGRAIGLESTDAQVKGAVGTQPVLLQVQPKDGGLELGGTFDGRIGTLAVTPAQIEGTVGRCSYDLKSSAPDTYVGQRSCGGLPSATTVKLPRSLAARPQGERAAILAVLLAS
jgi:hypothetical protein